MLKTKEQFKKAVVKNRVITALSGLAFASGAIAMGFTGHYINKKTFSVIKNSQAYIDYYEQTQQELLENGEITEKEYQDNINKGPDTSSTSNYNKYIYKAGTKEEIEQYLKLGNLYWFSLVGTLFCSVSFPFCFLFSTLKKQSLKNDFEKNKETVELIDDNKNQL